MSEQNKAVVRRYVEGLNEENLAVFDEILAPEFTNHSPRLGIMSREKTVNDYARFWKALPDCHRTIEDIFAEGGQGVPPHDRARDSTGLRDRNLN